MKATQHLEHNKTMHQLKHERAILKDSLYQRLVSAKK